MIYSFRTGIIACCFLVQGINAQNNTVSSGSDIQGPGGTIHQSVGQVFYEPLSGAGTSITQGLQQTYDISVETGIEQKAIALSLAVYPNPTTDQVVLSVQMDYAGMYYQLTDLQGKLLLQEEIKGASGTISLAPYNHGAYLVKVFKQGELQKSFKLIKN